MKESRANSSFLPSGLSPSAPEYGPVGLHRLNLWACAREGRGLSEEVVFSGLTAGAGIPPAPESYAGSYTIIGAFLQGSISAGQHVALRATCQHFSLSAFCRWAPTRTALCETALRQKLWRALRSNELRHPAEMLKAGDRRETAC